MKKVIKSGNKFKNQIKNFTCPYCRCEFITDEYDIYYRHNEFLYSQVEEFTKTVTKFRKRVDSYSSICPECNRTIQQFIPENQKIWIEE